MREGEREMNIWRVTERAGERGHNGREATREGKGGNEEGGRAGGKEGRDVRAGTGRMGGMGN